MSNNNNKKIGEAPLFHVIISTGFGTGGATAADIKLMRETVGSEMGVKASGGVRNLADLEVMVENGATRIGASSLFSEIKNTDILEVKKCFLKF